MDIIWVVRGDSLNNKDLDKFLSENFAVQFFSSLRSLNQNASMVNTQQPKVVIFNAHIKEAEKKFLEKFSSSLFVLFSKTGVSAKNQNISMDQKFYNISDVGGHFNLIRFLKKLCLLNSKSNAKSFCSYRDLELDGEHLNLRVLPNDDFQSLTHTEYKLLKILMQAPSSCLSREDIKKKVWLNVVVAPRTIDSYISRLRLHLKESAVSIESVYGGGYILS